MKIAIPLRDNLVSDLDDVCDQLTLVDVDPVERRILGSCRSGPLPRAVDELADWLVTEGTDLVIARHFGSDALGSLDAHGIRALEVANADTPHALIRRYLALEIDEGEGH